MPLPKKLSKVLIKVNICLPLDLRILLLSIYPKKLTHTHARTWVQMFTAALFPIAQNWKDPDQC